MYRFTNVRHNDPTLFAGSYSGLMEKIKAAYKGELKHKADDYGEGWLKQDGFTIGYIDQGPLIRDD